MLSKYEDFLDLDNTLWGFFATNNSCSKHFHRRTELSFIVSGEKTIIVGEEVYIAREGDVVFIPQYHPHQYLNCENCTDYIFCLPINAMNDLTNTFKNHSLPIIMDDKEFNRTEILPLLEKFFKYVSCDNRLIVRSYANIILSLLFSHYKSHTQSPLKDFDIATDILAYIEEHYKENLTLESLASHFNYDRFYFSKYFNKHFNINLKNYINSVRTQHFIAELRKNPNQNITDLIFAMGFSSTSTFYRFFYENFHKSPKELLNEL